MCEGAVFGNIRSISFYLTSDDKYKCIRNIEKKGFWLWNNRMQNHRKQSVWMETITIRHCWYFVRILLTLSLALTPSNSIALAVVMVWLHARHHSLCSDVAHIICGMPRCKKPITITEAHNFLLFIYDVFDFIYVLHQTKTMVQPPNMAKAKTESS